MRFDWYGASIPGGNPEAVVQACLHELDLSSVSQSAPKNGFRNACQIVRGSENLATVMWGGASQAGAVFAQSTGHHAPLFADCIRRNFPEAHKVIRADIAEDYDDPKAWEKLYAMGTRVADKYGLKTYCAGDYHRGLSGRTLYLGSPQSVCQTRIYEKGKKEGGNPDWVRLELVVRPKRSAARWQLSGAMPAEFWGCAEWTIDLAERVGCEDLTRIQAGTVWRKPEQARARSALMRQWWPTIYEWEQEVGSWDALGAAMMKLRSELDDETFI